MPDFGHPDWQGLVAWDGESLLDDAPLVNVGTPREDGPYNVSRWHGLAIFFTAVLTGGIARLKLEWYADSGTSLPLGHEEVVILSGASSLWHEHIFLANRGPYVRVVREAAIINLNIRARVVPTNRQILPPSHGGQDVLWKTASQSVGSGATMTVNLPPYYGEAMFAANTDAASFEARIEVGDFTNSYFLIYVETVVANMRRGTRLILPPLANRVRFTNNDGASRLLSGTVIPNRG